MALADDDRTVGRNVVGATDEVATRQVSKADHAGAAGPTKRLDAVEGFSDAHRGQTIGGDGAGVAIQLRSSSAAGSWQVAKRLHSATACPAICIAAVRSGAHADDHRSVGGNVCGLV